MTFEKHKCEAVRCEGKIIFPKAVFQAVTT